MRNTFLLPKRVTARPLKGMVTNWPMGRPSKIVPSAASLKCRALLISGIRLAQLAKHTPWQKKNTDTAMRTCRREYMWGMVVAVKIMCSNDTKIIQNKCCQNKHRGLFNNRHLTPAGSAAILHTQHYLILPVIKFQQYSCYNKKIKLANLSSVYLIIKTKGW